MFGRPADQWAARVLRGVGADVNRGIEISARQIQSKFKHAADFGVTGNYGKATAKLYEAAIQWHVRSESTVVVKGTHRGKPATHIFDPKTGLNVIRDEDGRFLSGWKLSADQERRIWGREAMSEADND